MAKSSKKQCRKPRPQRQGGLVVVSREVVSAAVTKPGETKTPKPKRKKKKKGDILRELMVSGDSDEDDNFNDPPRSHPSSPRAGVGEVAEFLFSSAHHTRQQRLYYLLATRPAPTQQSAGDQQQGGDSGVAAAATMEGGCHALVFVEAIAVAQELVGELKALNLVAFALHERTPKAQVQEHIKRFLAASSTVRSSVLILTNSAIARSPPSIGPVSPSQGSFLRIVYFDRPEGVKNATARGRVASDFARGRSVAMVQAVHLDGDGDTEHLPPFSFDSAAMAGVRSRLIVARKLSRAVALSAGEGEERGMRRAAAAAGLEWDGDVSQSENGEEAVKRQKRRGHAQQAVSLRQKLSVLLCQPMLPPTSSAASAGESSTPATNPASTNARQSAKELRKKMAVLGMIHGPEEGVAGRGPSGSAAGRKAGAPEDRTAARTRWLDGSAGQLFGGGWPGDIRTGASCDSASLELRARVEAAKQASSGAVAATSTTGCGGKGDSSGGGVGEGNMAANAALAKWNPNPDTPDPEKWGGRWGKPCGHNEVVLQHVRPFAPIEVMNTRMCSKASPAPGNMGFDGCLELLSLTCQARQRALTVWDYASFVHIDRTGASSSLSKKAMLHFPLPTLRFLVKNMKTFTVCGGGQQPPRDVARAVVYSVAWGAKQSTFGPLSAELSRRVMSFVLSGDLATWRSVSMGLGVGGVHQASASTLKASPRYTLAFASKKKRKNFNL